jgi:hypothetical protein
MGTTNIIAAHTWTEILVKISMKEQQKCFHSEGSKFYWGTLRSVYRSSLIWIPETPYTLQFLKANMRLGVDPFSLLISFIYFFVSVIYQPLLNLILTVMTTIWRILNYSLFSCGLFNGISISSDCIESTEQISIAVMLARELQGSSLDTDTGFCTPSRQISK